MVTRARCRIRCSEHRLELVEQVRLLAEVAEIRECAAASYRGVHAVAVVAVEGVAVDERGLDPLAPEDLLEGAPHRRRARA
jgi:hypothetical protein